MVSLTGLLEALLMLFNINIVMAKTDLKLLHEWKEIEFQFPHEVAKQEALNKNHYVKGASFIIDVDVHYKIGGRSRIFMTTPRFDVGRPMTLAVVTKESGPGGPVVEAYPDYTWHKDQGQNCDGMTSVLRIAIDECSRMWVVDTGKINDAQVCPPQLLVFDLNTDHLIHRHKFSDTLVKQSSLFVTPVLDIRDPKNGCKDTFVYIADVTGFGIIVYDQSTDSSWRVENKLFYPSPPQGTFNIAGETFELMDGVIGLALSPLGADTDRTLYFHSLASVTENSVKTSVLRNATAWKGFPSANPRDFMDFPMTRSSQAAAQAMDRNGILFFGLATPRSIACWDSTKQYSTANIDIVAHDKERLQFASGVKVINNAKGGQELWVVSCRFQKVMTGTMNSNEVNFRIMAANIDDLVRDTKCARRPNGPGAPQNNLVGGGGGSLNYGGVRFP